MRSTKAKQRHAAVDVLPVVVRVRYPQVALILSTIVVTVPHKRSLKVVVEVSVANSQVIRAMAEIRRSVVEVFVVGLVRG